MPTGIKITAFNGIAPKSQARLLDNGMAQVADNIYLISSSLEPWNKPLAFATNDIASGAKTIFRMSDGANSYWLSWDSDVNCIPSLIAGDEAQRIYYTGDGEPRISNLASAKGGGTGVMPAACFVLGVPAPLVAPTVTPSGGVGAATSRAYIETFVTPWGEEGAPSPASAVTAGKEDDTWALTALNAAPINSAAISGATHASGVVTVTTASTKYLRTGEEVTISSVAGMTDLNGTHTITEVTDATHFKVTLSTAQTYTSGGTWTRVAPHNTTGMTRRIYRTSAGVYRFVAEIAIGTTSYNDTIAETALGEICPSIGWDMPPVGLTGLVSHPMGFLVGFSGKDICFSDPWHPHAWPATYRQTTKFQIVGLGVYLSSIVACTAGTPYVLNGSHPDSISMEQVELVEPCLSKRSVIDVGTGVMYAAPSGYVFVGIGGANVTTQALLSRKDWLGYNPANLHCTYYDGMVIGLSSTPNAGERSGFIFDSKNVTFTSLSVLTTATYVDPTDGNLYLVSDGLIKMWAADTNNRETYEWKSKVFVFPKAVNLGAAQVDADYDTLNDAQAAEYAAQTAADIAYNTAILASGDTYGELGASMLGEYMLDGSLLRGGIYLDYVARFIRFQLYADGALKYTEAVMNGKSFSMPAGYKAARYELVLSGNVPVYGVKVAETASGLRNI